MLSGGFSIHDLLDINVETSKPSILDGFTKEFYFFTRTNGRNSPHTLNLIFESNSPPSNEAVRLPIAGGALVGLNFLDDETLLRIWLQNSSTLNLWRILRRNRQRRRGMVWAIIVRVLFPLFRTLLPSLGASLLRGSAAGVGNSGVAFLGKGGSGKSRLLKEFLQRGFNYYSDEIFFITSNGSMLSFPTLFERKKDDLPEKIDSIIPGCRVGTSCRLNTVFLLEREDISGPKIHEVDTERIVEVTYDKPIRNIILPAIPTEIHQKSAEQGRKLLTNALKDVTAYSVIIPTRTDPAKVAPDLSTYLG